MLSAADVCKQFAPRSGPTECRTLSGFKLSDTLIVFLKEFFEKVNFVKTNFFKKLFQKQIWKKLADNQKNNVIMTQHAKILMGMYSTKIVKWVVLLECQKIMVHYYLKIIHILLCLRSISFIVEKYDVPKYGEY